MRSYTKLHTRDLSDLFGLPASLTIVLIVVVPILVISSTGLLIFYYVRSRRRRLSHSRNGSKSSQSTTSLNHDQELGLTAVPYRPGTAGSQQSSIRFASINEKNRRVVAGHVKGAGSEVFDVHQYESERADQRKRDMVLPSPPASPTRDTSILNNLFQPDMSVLNQPRDRYSQADFERRSKSAKDVSSPRSPPKPTPRYPPLQKPPPIRVPARTNSPVSPRSLSIFPPKHCLRNSSAQSPSTWYSTTPSPSLVTPVSSDHSFKLPPVPQPRIHRRHPSIDRNSAMPIAPILIPDIAPSRHVLPTLEEGHNTPDHERDSVAEDYDRWRELSTRGWLP
jgi:hypothetical protein